MSTMPPSAAPDPPDEITEALRVPITSQAGGLPTGPMVRANVNLKLGEVALQTKVAVPAGATTLRQLLPVARAFTDAIVHAATERTHAAGQTISCKNRCAACCRKLVPVSVTEATMLAALVAAMPEPRRSEIQARFLAARERLAGAGLLGPLEGFSDLAPDVVDAISTAYFQQHIGCPFLEEESCSIYADRPLVCREYLVTSEAALCGDVGGQVRVVNLPGYMSKALGRCSDADGQARRRVPLTLALEWAASNAEATASSTGPELLRQLLAGISQAMAG